MRETMRGAHLGRGALVMVAVLALSVDARAGCGCGGVVTVGGPVARTSSPPEGFYGGFAALPQAHYQQTARTSATADHAVVRTAYQEPGQFGAAATPPPLDSAPVPPAANGAATNANANAYVPPPRPIPSGAINYNNGFEYLSPATVLAPMMEGPMSGHGRRWIRFYFPPGMTYFHDNGYQFVNGYGYGYGYGY